MPRTRCRASALATVALCLSAAPAAAQLDSPPTANAPFGRPRHAAAILVGASQFDMSGTGTAAFASARIEREVQRWLVAEGALGLFRPREQFGRQDTYAIPEAQLQLQLPLGVVRPYLGAGAGYLLGGDRTGRGSASGSAGLRATIPGTALDARGELRVRGVGRNFGAAMAEWTLGAGWRF